MITWTSSNCSILLFKKHLDSFRNQVSCRELVSSVYQHLLQHSYQKTKVIKTEKNNSTGNLEKKTRMINEHIALYIISHHGNKILRQNMIPLDPH